MIPDKHTSKTSGLFDFELERTIIGSLIIDNTVTHIVTSILKPEDFYYVEHELIYCSIISLMGKDIPIDLVTLTEEMKKNGSTDSIGGPVYIAECTNYVASTSNIEYHCKILLQMSIGRSLVKVCIETSSIAHDPKTDPFELINQHEQKIKAIEERIQLNKSPKKQDISTEVLDDIVAAAEKGGVVGEQIFGIPELDKMIDGGEPGDLIVIAGRPGMGKSTLANTILKNYGIEQDKKVVFWALETSNRKSYRRLLSNVSNILHEKLKTGTASIHDQDITDAVMKINESNITFLDDSGVNIADIRSRLVMMHRTEGVDLLMLDHGGLISLENFDRNKNDAEKIGLMTSVLVRTAKELKIPVILFWQLNRAVETRGGSKRPQMSDLRNSGRIEEDATKIIFLYRPEYYEIIQDEMGNSLEGVGFALVAKSKDGETGKVKMLFKPELCRFEPEKNDYYPSPENNMIPAAAMTDEEIPF